MKSSFKTIGMMLMAAFVGFGMTACSEKEDPEGEGNKEPDKPVVEQKAEIHTIKILNAGENGDKVVEGKIDEVTSTITFPRISSRSNFAAIKFGITGTEGTKLEKETYDFTMAEGKTETEVVLKAVNGKKWKEYLCTIGMIAPLSGADFTKAETKHIEASAFPAKHRWSAIDNQNIVLVADKEMEVISIDDVMAGKAEFKALDMTGVSGGWPAVAAGAAANGHFYGIGIESSATTPFKIFYWDNVTSKAETIYDPGKLGDIAPENPNGRYGDNMCMDLDKDGNGYMFLFKNLGDKKYGTPDILRLTVKNHKEISDPKVLKYEEKYAYTFDTMTKVEGTEFYMRNGSGVMPKLVDADNNTITKFTANIQEELTSFRIFTFNNKRYLLGITLGNKVSKTDMYVYEFPGKTLDEAIEKFLALEEFKPVYTVNVGDGGKSSTASACTNYRIEKDEKGHDVALYIAGASKKGGLTVAKIPALVNE